MRSGRQHAAGVIDRKGATHGATPCMPCEAVAGQYSDSVKNFFDYVGNWINARYSPNRAGG